MEQQNILNNFHPSEREDRLVAALLPLHDPRERLSELLSRRHQTSDFAENSRCESNLIRGCSSPLWLHRGLEDGLCRFAAQSGAQMMNELAAACCSLVDRVPPGIVAAFEIRFVERLGLDRILTPLRLNGLAALRAEIRRFAAQNSEPADSDRSQ